MELILKVVDVFLHLDKHLGEIIQSYGIWTYLILFVVVFCETGLVATPFLPGDSLLFATGAFAASGSFNVLFVFVLLTLAAIIGDTVNYWIGYYVGPKVFHKDKSIFFKKEHLIRTQKFYEKHGGKTIIIARFVPIIRTFAPFVAGIGKMSYWKFIVYNITGGISWTTIFIFCGYYFGNLPFVKKNFSLVIMVIIILSIMPGVFEYIKHKKETAAMKSNVSY
jgi:membrane-associated protein